ncbi:hypothetical protein [Actinomycetospora soli]|uniref:hypothetical protein n=1 Tax=Actinomycetospora soli TaxID=2893887 RepID=UPI001E33C7B2|nr:hypothetical protein [Actinomycetospora soli]MCD2188774.1 hypothetical protein [Actinomycetospora soli]
MTSTGARALGVGALAPALGVAAHVEAGGGTPDLTAPVVLVAFLTAGVAALAVRRRVPVVRLVAVLGAGQVGWHLTMGAGPGDPHAGHDVAHALPSPGMVAAHALATLLVALGAAGADRAVRTLLARRVGAVLALLGSRPVVAAPSAPPAVPGPAATPVVAAALLRVRPLRGPPVRPAVA